MSNTPIDKGYFKSIDTEGKAYWSGFLMADASVSDSGNIKLDLAIKDSSHVLKFTKAVGSGYKVKHRPCSRGNMQCTTTIYSKDMCKDLFEIGVTPRKSLSAIPPVVLPNLERHFFRGLIDGDGWIYESKNGRVIQVGICGSSSVCDSFSQWVFGLCGYKPSVRQSGNIHVCVVSSLGASLTVLSELYIGAIDYLDRKKEKALGLLRRAC